MNSEYDEDNPPSIASSNFELSPNSSTSSRKHKLQLRINSKDLEYDSDGGSIRKANNSHSSDDGHGGASHFLKKHLVKGALNVTNILHNPHIEHMEKSFTDLKEKLFHGKSIKKLKGISKRRKQRKRSVQDALRRKVSKVMNSNWAMIVMLLATVYLLFIDDFMLATGAPDDHISFTVVSSLKIVVFLIFIADLFCSIFVQRLHYVLTFYFPIDLISIASLVPDIISFIFGISSITHAINSLSLSRTARVARIASRLSRISKIINFFNLLQCSKRVEDTSTQHQVQAAVEPSSIGKQLLTKTSHKIMLMALLIVLITILTNPQYDTEPYNISLLNLFMDSPNPTESFQSFNDNNDNVDILLLVVNNTVIYETSEDTSIWFYSYIEKVNIQGAANELWINNKKNEQYLAALAICLTVCLIIILLFGTLLVSRDFQILVIKPIERMISLIKKISQMDRGNDSEYDSSENDDFSGDEGINMSDTDLENQSQHSETTESFGGYDDEPETNIIVELLNDIACKKIDNHARQKTLIEVHAQIRSGFESLLPVTKAFCQRKEFLNETKRYSQKEKLVKELIATEQSYVTSLGVCIDEYLIPLRIQGGDKHLITQDQLNEIFSNIEVIHEFNKGFLKALEEKLGHWSINSGVGDVFNYIIDGATDVYAQYVNNYTNSMKVYDECKKEEKFLELITDIRDNKAKSDLGSFLIMPIQRMPRYVMILEGLSKFTALEHYDKENIENNVRQLKKLTVVLNERKRDSENKTTIRDIYMKLVPPEPEILSPGNALLLNTSLKQDSEKYQFFLFQNGLLKTEKKENELHVIQYVPIKDSTVLTITPLQDCPSMKIHDAFQLKIDNELILLFAKTTEIRNNWVNAIAQCSKVQHQRTKSMHFMANRKLSVSRGSVGGLGAASPNMSSSRLSVLGASNKSGLSNSNLSSTFANSNNNNINNSK